MNFSRMWLAFAAAAWFALPGTAARPYFRLKTPRPAGTPQSTSVRKSPRDSRSLDEVAESERSGDWERIK